MFKYGDLSDAQRLALHEGEDSALQPPALGGEPDFELVEPVAPWFYFAECDDPDYSGLFNHESEAQTQANDHGGSVIKLWNVPPTWKPAKGLNADFWQWLDSAYRDGSKGEHAQFTKYNMEVAYSAGRAIRGQPPAKIVLPKRKFFSTTTMPVTDACVAKGYNLCLDEVAKLNGIRS